MPTAYSPQGLASADRVAECRAVSACACSLQRARLKRQRCVRASLLFLTDHAIRNHRQRLDGAARYPFLLRTCPSAITC
eukprot:6176549-Pleurochrysis_carterae.AAC.2